MQELAKIENSAVALVKEHPLMVPPVLQQNKQDLFRVVMSSIARCYADLNQRTPDDLTQEYLVNEVTDNILSRFPSIRLHEIPVAFSNGIRGVYGEYFGLNVITFEKFIEGYLNSDARLRLAEQKVAIVENQTPKVLPSPAQIFDTAKSIVIEDFEHFKNGRFRDRTALTSYIFLDKLGVVTFDNKQKKDFLKQAIPAALAAMQIDYMNAKELSYRRQKLAEIEVYKHAVDNDLELTKEHSRLVLNTAKKLAYKNLLSDFELIGEDIGKHIDGFKSKFLQNEH